MIYRWAMGGAVISSIVALMLIFFDSPHLLQMTALTVGFIFSIPFLFRTFKNAWELVKS